MSISGPTRCPDCRYSLKGLPRAHRCPECGFEYDEQTVIWRPNKPRRAYYGLAWFLVMMPSAITQFIIPLIQGRLLNVFAFVQSIVVLTIVVSAVCLTHLSIKRGRCVAISARGISIRTITGLVRIPWRELETASWDGGALQLVRRGRLFPVGLGSILAGKEEADEFRAEVGKARIRYAQQGNPESPKP